MLIELFKSIEVTKVMTANKVPWIYLLGLSFVQLTFGLKITSLNVPKKAWDSVLLNCKYDLEGERLYAVKWYKDQTEFFRCFENGTIQSFPLKDIHVGLATRSQTGSCFFELTILSSKSGGEYMCEVSLDYPTFRTVDEKARLEVMEPSIQQEITTEDVVSISLTESKGSVMSTPIIIISLLMLLVIYIFYQ